MPLPYLLTGALVQLIGGPDHRYRTNVPAAAGTITAGWSVAVLLPILTGTRGPCRPHGRRRPLRRDHHLLVRFALAGQRAATALAPLAGRTTVLWVEAHPYAKP